MANNVSRNLGNNVLWGFEYTSKDAPKKAVDTTKYSYLLINNEGDTTDTTRFGQSSVDNVVYVDWELDGNGFIRKASGDGAKVQTTLKMLFTEKQLDGYGTHMYDYVGIKDFGARRLALFMDITMAILTLKSALTAEANRQNLTIDELIATVTSLAISEDETDNRAVRIKASLQSSNGSQLPVTVL